MTITGRVIESREAVVELRVHGPGGEPATITAVIDTGFTAYLTLQPSLIERLDLPWLRRGRAVLADGRAVAFDVHEASVEWDGEPRRIAVSVADAEPLIGMAMLEGHTLCLDVEPTGRVTIERLQ